MLRDKTHTMNSGKDKKRQVRTDKHMSIAHCISPEVLNKTWNNSNKLKYIDSSSVNYSPKSKKMTLEKTL